MPESTQGHVIKRNRSTKQRREQISVPDWDDIMFRTARDEEDDPAADPPAEDRAVVGACSCTCHEVDEHPPTTEIEQRMLSTLRTFERMDLERMTDTLDRMNAQLDRWAKQEAAAASTTAYLRIQLQALATTLGREQ